MPPANPPVSDIPPSAGTPVITARIDALDVPFVSEIREFLTRSGVDTYMHDDTRTRVTYWIITGDISYVKTILESKKVVYEKCLAVIYSGVAEDLNWHMPDGIKTVYVDTEPLTPHVTQLLFRHLFTSPEPVQNFRKHLIKSTRFIPANLPPLREPSSGGASEPRTEPEDRHRIAVLMNQMFSKRMPEQNTHENGKRKHRYPMLEPVFAGIAIFMLPFAAYIMLVGTALGTAILNHRIHRYDSISILSISVPAASWSLERSLDAVHLFSRTASLISLPIDFSRQEHLLTFFSYANQAEMASVNARQLAQAISNKIWLPGQTGKETMVSDILGLRMEVAKAAERIALAKAQATLLEGNLPFPFSVPVLRTYLSDATATLSRMHEDAQTVHNIMTIYPYLAGFRSPQRYLVLVQDSLSLRPAGGRITGVILLTFSGGVVSDVQAYGIDEIDSVFKGQIDPPEEVRTALGIDQWYLGESNWNPDFRISGKQAQWFFEKETGTSVDGVIAVSLPALAALLTVTGPVDVPELNERISESNLYVKTLFYGQDSTDGNAGKPDFLVSLTRAALAHSAGNSVASAPALAGALTHVLNAREIQLYFADPQLEHLITQWRWNGSLPDGDCPPGAGQGTCLADGLTVVTANTGGNSMDYFVRTEVLDRVTLQPNGQVTHTITYGMKNTAPDHVSKEGEYRAYVRWFFPSGTHIDKVLRNGKDLPVALTRNESVSSGAAYINDAVLELPVRMYRQEQQQITITTSRSLGKVFGSAFTYWYAVRKQAGVSGQQWSLILEYPPSWQAESSYSVAKTGQLEYNTTLTSDIAVPIVITTTL